MKGSLKLRAGGEGNLPIIASSSIPGGTNPVNPVSPEGGLPLSTLIWSSPKMMDLALHERWCFGDFGGDWLLWRGLLWRGLLLRR